MSTDIGSSYGSAAGTGLGTLDMDLATLAATAKNASALTLAAFQVADQIATQCITQSHVGYTTLTGWSFNNGATYGTDYLSRASKAPRCTHARTPGLFSGFAQAAYAAAAATQSVSCMNSQVSCIATHCNMQ